MTSGRLEAFTDGVVAIIITIMVLELKVPESGSLAALRNGRVRQCGVISGVAPGRHRQAALGVICSWAISSIWGVASAIIPSSCM